MSGAGESRGCIFCTAQVDADASRLVIWRGSACFVVLNLYPYTNGHLMIVPNRHVATMADATAAELGEMIQATRMAEMALTQVYRPHGLNVGMNLGRAAGAGVADHMHIHVVPRWAGDTNFMSVVGEVRVLPEELEQTAARLRPVFARLAPSRGEP